MTGRHTLGSEHTAAARATGYDPSFLGPPIPMPTLPGVDTVLLAYTNFSVLMRPDRRLAAITAVVIDGASIVAIRRGNDTWQLDPRLPTASQAGKEVYADNDLDRGHLTRRRDPAWGPDAAAANADTFHFTNAAPQAAQFNQSKELWNGLEDYLLDNATGHLRRLVVFTGPVLQPDDPPYRGVQIPRQFFKVAAFLDGDDLACTGYLLDQTPQLDDIDLRSVTAERAAKDEPPPLGPYKTFQLPVESIAELTGLDLGALPALDRFDADLGATRPLRRKLLSYDDITWQNTDDEPGDERRVDFEPELD